MQRVLSFPPQSNRRFADTSEVMSKRMCFSLTFSIMFLSVLAGFLLGRFVFDQELELSKAKLRRVNQQQATGLRLLQMNASSLINQISSESLQQHLRLLNDGLPESRNIHEAQLMRSLMKEGGFDLVSSLVDSQTNLSFPDGINQIFLLHGRDIKLTINDSRTGVSSSGGYRTSAIVTGNIFYVNFGRDEDYHHLDSLGLSVKDSIVLARIGRTPPVDLVANAIEHEAIGIILYRDPQQKDIKSTILTPIDLARLEFYKSPNADKAIPVITITSQDAERLLGEMSTSESSSESWRGDLNSSYPIGPGFIHSDKKIQMRVNTVTVIKKFYDVIGVIRGTQEPDRFVVVAHERTPDEAGKESTAIIMEIIKAFGILKKSNDWRPYRSIVIASWGMEGHYNVHAGDWSRAMEQLKSKAVAYLKIESALLGNDSISSRGSPILEKIFHEASDEISADDSQLDPMLITGEDINLVESGIPFLQLKQNGVSRIKEVTSFWGYLTWKLSENSRLPFTLDSYVKFFNHSLAVIEKKFKILTQKHSLFLESFFEATQRLIVAISSFQSNRSSANSSIYLRTRNDQFLTFSRALSCPKDKSHFHESFRHLIFSRSTHGHDSKAGFGLLQDLLRETTSTEAPEDLQSQIINHLADLVDCINSARFALTDGLESLLGAE